MGVDGFLSGGYVFNKVKYMFTLQADSPSNFVFDQWKLTQDAQEDTFPCNGNLLLKSLGTKWTWTRGFMTEWKPAPDIKKILQPRKYGYRIPARLPATVELIRNARRPRKSRSPPENRDKGRTYLLTEMPALQAERWARHAIMAMNREDLDIRSEIAALGMWGFVLGGLQALAGGDRGRGRPDGPRCYRKFKSSNRSHHQASRRRWRHIWEVIDVEDPAKGVNRTACGFSVRRVRVDLGGVLGGRQQSDSQNTETSPNLIGNIISVYGGGMMQDLTPRSCRSRTVTICSRWRLWTRITARY